MTRAMEYNRACQRYGMLFAIRNVIAFESKENISYPEKELLKLNLRFIENHPSESWQDVDDDNLVDELDEFENSMSARTKERFKDQLNIK